MILGTHMVHGGHCVVMGLPLYRKNHFLSGYCPTSQSQFVEHRLVHVSSLETTHWIKTCYRYRYSKPIDYSIPLQNKIRLTSGIQDYKETHHSLYSITLVLAASISEVSGRSSFCFALLLASTYITNSPYVLGITFKSPSTKKE